MVLSSISIWPKNSRLTAVLVGAWAFVSLSLMPLALANEPTNCGPSLTFEKNIPDGVCSLLEQHLSRVKTSDSPSPFALRKEAKVIADDLRKILISEGYYAAKVSPQVRRVGSKTKLEYGIEVGPYFKITDYVATYEGAKDRGDLPQPQEGETATPGSPKGGHIVEVQKALVERLHNNGYPFAKVRDRHVNIRIEEGNATVVFRVDQGSHCRFGPVIVTGLDHVRKTHVESLITIPAGEPCSREVLLEQKAQLAKSGLFSIVEIEPDASSAIGNVMPLRLNLTEKPHRTIGLGLSYESNVGFGSNFTWEHRNVFGAGERLRAEVKAHEIVQHASLRFRKPYPQRHTTLLGSVNLTHETKDAFDATQAGTSFGYERSFLKTWRLTYTVDLEYAEVESEGRLEKGMEISLPIQMQRIELDAPLDPQQGYKISFLAVPVQTAIGDGAAFVSLDARSSYHVALPQNTATSVALWFHMGSTQGGTLSDIPATRRFYGGGAQSVRAIEYEHLGHLDTNGTPIGGRSILEGGIELRSRLGKNWGTALFIEGGRSFEAAFPDFGDELLWGGGFGIRYRTPIGPLRIDIAAPFNARPSDDPFQIYIGLGQAF